MSDGERWLMSLGARKLLSRTESIADVRKSRMEEEAGSVYWENNRGQERRVSGGDIGIQNMAEKWGGVF